MLLSLNVDVIFHDDDLDRLETDPHFSVSVPPQVIKAFRKKMQAIRAANDERDFYKMKSFQFEKLQGKRKHQYSMRLNDQYRLVLELLKEEHGGSSKIKIMAIEDYH